MKSDFQKAKIYKITNDFNDHVFIGSTCDTLSKNFSKHKSDSQYRKSPLYKLMNEIGFERFRIELICNFPCEDKYQLCQKTSEYIRLYGKELNLHGDEQKERRKQQKEEQHKSIESKVKEELEKRINKFREINSIILCDCGCEVVKRGLKAHQKTQKHLDLMESTISSLNSE